MKLHLFHVVFLRVLYQDLYWSLLYLCFYFIILLYLLYFALILRYFYIYMWSTLVDFVLNVLNKGDLNQYSLIKSLNHWPRNVYHYVLSGGHYCIITGITHCLIWIKHKNCIYCGLAQTKIIGMSCFGPEKRFDQSLSSSRVLQSVSIDLCVSAFILPHLCSCSSSLPCSSLTALLSHFSSPSILPFYPWL